MNKKTLLLIISTVLTLILALGIAGCSNNGESSHVKPPKQIENSSLTDNAKNDTGRASASSEKTADITKDFTLEQLAKYDGKNGNPAYAAVDGIVYDITNNRAWRDGEHEAYKAGTDLTKDMANAPHGRRVLNDLPVVGKLVK